jgi:hypothetical protein
MTDDEAVRLKLLEEMWLTCLRDGRAGTILIALGLLERPERYAGTDCSPEAAAFCLENMVLTIERQDRELARLRAEVGADAELKRRATAAVFGKES